MPAYAISLSDVDRNSVALVGGKGANLGELCRLGMPVPGGFCLTVRAFRRFLEWCPELDKLYARLEHLDYGDRTAVSRLAEEFRCQLADLPVPDDVQAELLDFWRRSGSGLPHAVRSSATAEDLPGASFAGQHDTFLNVTDTSQLVNAVRQCWISLFTDRGIGYRARHGFDHREVDLAVVIQRMIVPEASGVMFTADPVSGHRGTTVINAAYGLGEAVVSGLLNPDLYRIGADGVLHKSIADKRLAVVALPAGGVTPRDVDTADRTAQALGDARIRELADLGRRIQHHFGAPQDIEWALADGRLQILQSRPITSLYPLPDPPDDGRLHVYFSFGHQQMMTDPIKPLGLSVLRTFFPFGQRSAEGESSRLVAAGGRLFFDYTDPLHARFGRLLLAWAAGSMDKRAGEALLEIAARPAFQRNHRFKLNREIAIDVFVARALARVVGDLSWASMSSRQQKMQDFLARTLARSRGAISGSQGAERIARIQADLTSVPAGMFYQLTLTQVSAMAGRRLIERLSQRWLGDAADVPALDKSLPGNVTTEMALAIGDLADQARDNPALLALLQSPPEPFSLDSFSTVPGGAAFGAAFREFLDRYGMRGPGEIDITRVRWGEQPAQLFPGILANVRAGAPGQHRERFQAGAREAEKAAEDVLGRNPGHPVRPAEDGCHVPAHHRAPHPDGDAGTSEVPRRQPFRDLPGRHSRRGRGAGQCGSARLGGRRRLPHSAGTTGHPGGPAAC